MLGLNQVWKKGILAVKQTRWIYLFILCLLPFSAWAEGESLRPYRWKPKVWKPLPYLLSASFDSFVRGEKPEAPIQVSFGELAKSQDLLPSNGEIVGRGSQMIGPAKVDGTWTQTIFHPDGHVLYAAGEVFDRLPHKQWIVRLRHMEANKSTARVQAEKVSQGYKFASRRTPPEIRLRKKDNGAFEAYWRFEYMNQAEDGLYRLHLSETGKFLEETEISPPGVDGLARVYLEGQKFGDLSEVQLYGLLADGTLSSRRLRITSALDIQAVSQNFVFFYPVEDRRFDFAQAYYSIDRAFRWLKDTVGADLEGALEVRLHVGNNGVSNAAFYHNDVIYLGTGDGITYRELLKDPSVLTHEAIHAMIDDYVGLPSEGEGGSYNEGFADLFAALILQNPRMGESSYLKGPYRRTLEHDLKAYRDFTGGVYRNGSIVAATFWDLKPILGEQRLARLAFRTLTRLGKGAGFKDFVPALTGASAGFLEASEERAVMDSVARRGWVVVP